MKGYFNHGHHCFQTYKTFYLVQWSMHIQIIMYKILRVTVVQLILNTDEYCQCHQRQGKIFREQYFRRKKSLLLYGYQTIFVVVWALWIQHTLLQTDRKKLVLDILQWFQISIITWKKFLFMSEIIQWCRLRIIILKLYVQFVSLVLISFYMNEQ